MFGFLKKKIFGAFSSFSKAISNIFVGEKIDDAQLEKLLELLIRSEVGAVNSKKIISKLKEKVSAGEVKNSDDVESLLKRELISILSNLEEKNSQPEVIVLVGINGTGKTTSAAKLASQLKNQGKKVLLVAADTFRAAAVEQLIAWAEKIDVDIVFSKKHSDPAAIVFDGCEKFMAENYDHLIIDTAGRLHTKTNLISELEKLYKIIKKKCQEKSVSTWITIDSMLGQSSFNQAEVFFDAVKLDGIILTKTDSSAKGGVVFSIASKFKIPVIYSTFGESLDEIKEFDKSDYVQRLFDKS